MIVSPSKDGIGLDGSVLRIAQYIDTGGIPLLPMTRIEGYKFNPALLDLKEYILLDYSELYWNSENEDTHLFGKNTHEFPDQFPGDEWKKFEDFVRDTPPKIYLKRELKKKDVGGNIYPVDYPCWVQPYPVQTKEEFDNRPINCFYYWGRSSERRVKLHSDIWSNSSKNGAAICDNIFYIDNFLKEEKSKNKWVTLNIPHYSRLPIENILYINWFSKLSVSMRGSGNKCFRDSESPVNSIMIMEAGDDIAYAYDWVHGVNCFKMGKSPIESIEQALESKDLYEIYLNSMNTIDKYRINNYVNNYIQPIIKKA